MHNIFENKNSEQELVNFSTGNHVQHQCFSLYNGKEWQYIVALPIKIHIKNIGRKMFYNLKLHSYNPPSQRHLD